MVNKALVSQLKHAKLNQEVVSNVFKIAILGAESTGKSTLCQDLAAYYKTQRVVEYMRPYLQHKWDTDHESCQWADLLPIAKGQVALENRQSAIANRYVFCDTNLLQLMVYAYWYYDDCPDLIRLAVQHHHYDLILLTAVDIPWVADDLRDSPHQRIKINAAIENALSRHNRLFRRISGDRQCRVEQVVKWLEATK